MSAFNAIRGFKDIMPQEAALWRHIENVAKDVARRFDFQELRPPIAERTEIFARGIGEATDIVEKEMYTFDDKGGDKITLRPEATAGLVRAVIEHNLVEGGRSTRLFCMGPMFRYEKPQKGRFRQFHQIDAEIFGDPGPAVDAELLLWINTFLNEIGLDDLSINLNSLGCPDCRPGFRKKLVAFFTERLENLCPDCKRRLHMNPLRIIDCKIESCRKSVLGAPKISENLCSDCDRHFESVQNLLNLQNLKYVLNSNLVRGLDYYTRTAFEVISTNLGSQSAVAGGGRYDGLVQALGGANIPGIGFAAGMERLVMLLKDKGGIEDPGPDYYLAIISPAALEAAFSLAQNLRDQGLRVSADWEAGSLKSRMKRADKSKAAKVIMMGEDEIAKKEAIVRDLSTKAQTNFDLTPFLKN